jgi:hypothetical protein
MLTVRGEKNNRGYDAQFGVDGLAKEALYLGKRIVHSMINVKCKNFDNNFSQDLRARHDM